MPPFHHILGGMKFNNTCLLTISNIGRKFHGFGDTSVSVPAGKKGKRFWVYLVHSKNFAFFIEIFFYLS